MVICTHEAQRTNSTIFRENLPAPLPATSACSSRLLVGYYRRKLFCNFWYRPSLLLTDKDMSFCYPFIVPCPTSTANWLVIFCSQNTHTGTVLYVHEPTDERPFALADLWRTHPNRHDRMSYRNLVHPHSHRRRPTARKRRDGSVRESPVAGRGTFDSEERKQEMLRGCERIPPCEYFSFAESEWRRITCLRFKGIFRRHSPSTKISFLRIMENVLEFILWDEILIHNNFICEYKLSSHYPIFDITR